VLEERSGGPRRYRNMLVFAAAEVEPLTNLKESVRQFLAWSSIVREAEELNLDAGQLKQASDRRDNANGVVDQRIWETYQWLLVPSQAKDASEVSWDPTKIGGAEPIAEKASKKLIGQEGLIPEFGGVRLRLELDRIPLWRGNHVLLQQLWEDFAQYLYLPRLRDRAVLIGAVQDGIASMSWSTDTFGYAAAFEESDESYKGLEVGRQGAVRIDATSLVLKSEVASEQIGKPEPEPEPGPELSPGPTPTTYARFYGQVSLDPLRASTQVGQIIESVVNHLQSQPNAEVELTLEIHAEIPEGADEDTRRTVTENAATLKFKSHGFEA
ncbi:MAG: AAA+ family ATPase, partial [Actinobacteria bacterium]|nr:AAA+ family ATPase [Actinomycetota bacterium]